MCGIERRLRHDAEALDDVGDVAAGEADVAMPALADVKDESARGEQVDVFRGRRACQTAVTREFAHGPCAPVHESSAHRCA